MTRSDYERRIDGTVGERMRWIAEHRRGTTLHGRALVRYASVLRRLDWLPPAEITGRGDREAAECLNL